MKKRLLFIWFLVFFALLFSVTTNAYIDPSAMTYIIQIIAGVAIAAGAAFGFYIRKLKRAFSKFGQKSDNDDSWDYDEDDDDDTGYGDYELPEMKSTDEFAGQIAAEPSAPVREAAKPADAYFSNREMSIDEPIVSTAPDEYDETGGNGGLLAENRELRRLLALEREKVEILMQALNVCTEKRSK